MAAPLTPPPASALERLLDLIETLRGENGCPWDRKQTPETMARYLVEEVHELVDAIVSGEAAAVREEAGDVLFQLLFIVHLFTLSKQFSLGDVIEENIEKMVRRHPHVFGTVEADTAEKVRQNWDKIKRAEKGEAAERSVLGGVPHSLPALRRAAEVSARAAKTGFDWADIHGVMAKTMEEWKEFSEEIDRLAGDPSMREKAAMEFGDLLFTMVNVARFARVDPESSLLRSIQKFEKRFAFMERMAGESGRGIEQLDFHEMQRLWDDAKRLVG